MWILFVLLFLFGVLIFMNKRGLRGTFLTAAFILTAAIVLHSAEYGTVRRVIDTRDKLYDNNTIPIASLYDSIVEPEKISIKAYVDNFSPAIGSTINLLVYGPPGGRVTAIFHFKEHDQPSIFEIGKSGKEIKQINVATAAKGHTVFVDVIMEYKGKTYRANTMFTPN
jgi:hypothetical protein